MKQKVLITTTSFQDTPGAHHDRLKESGLELVTARGPLNEAQMLELVGDGNQFDGYLCGDDAFTEKVLKAAQPRIKVVSKYGIGLEKINRDAAKRLGIPVTFTPGVNHTTVAEHLFGLVISLIRQIPEQNQCVHAGQWKRWVGNELASKCMGVIGFGRIGKEVAKRAMCFGMKVVVYDLFWSDENDAYIAELTTAFSSKAFQEFPPSIKRLEVAEDILKSCDILSLNMNLTPENTEFINQSRIQLMKDGAIIANTSRGALVDQKAVADAVKSGKLRGYVADVVEPEPVTSDNPLLGVQNIVLTPHVGSRTYESVARQAGASVTNLLAVLNGEEPLAYAVKP